MQSEERAILIYMEHRDWIALGAILSECPEATKQVLEALVRRELLDYKKYLGEGNTQFYRPNDKGTRALLPWYINAMNYIAINWLAISGIAISVIGLIISITALNRH